VCILYGIPYCLHKIIIIMKIFKFKIEILNLMFIGPCIIAIVDE